MEGLEWEYMFEKAAVRGFCRSIVLDFGVENFLFPPCLYGDGEGEILTPLSHKQIPKEKNIMQQCPVASLLDFLDFYLVRALRIWAGIINLAMEPTISC